MPDPIELALDGLSARQVEALVAKAQKRLQTCVIDQQDGAIACRVTYHGHVITMMFCPACIERHRLPESRSEENL